MLVLDCLIQDEVSTSRNVWLFGVKILYKQVICRCKTLRNFISDCSECACSTEDRNNYVNDIFLWGTGM
jgi:hypothetical protein